VRGGGRLGKGKLCELPEHNRLSVVPKTLWRDGSGPGAGGVQPIAPTPGPRRRNEADRPRGMVAIGNARGRLAASVKGEGRRLSPRAMDAAEYAGGSRLAGRRSTRSTYGRRGLRRAIACYVFGRTEPRV